MTTYTTPRRHSDALNRVRLALSDLGAITLPQTVGMFTAQGSDRPVRIGLPGTADLIACWKGRFIACEIKVGPDRQRPEQKNFQAAIEAQGGLYILARFTDTQDGIATLKERLADVA